MLFLNLPPIQVPVVNAVEYVIIIKPNKHMLDVSKPITPQSTLINKKDVNSPAPISNPSSDPSKAGTRENLNTTFGRPNEDK